MNLTFQNPLHVSRGTKPDVMQMQIKPSAQALFVSQQTFKNIDGFQILEFALPTQLPKNIDEKKLKMQIQAANSAVSSTMIIELIVQVFLKGAMDDLILLILELQYIKNYQELDVVLPALIQIVNEKIEIIVEFKFLNPDAILKMIDKDLNMNKLMFQIDSDAEDKPVMKESFMTFVFLIGLFFMLFVIAFLVLNFSKSSKNKGRF